MIINKGKIVADGTSEELRKHAQGKEILKVTIEGAGSNDAFEKLSALETVELVDRISGVEGTFEVQSHQGQSSRKAIFRMCVDNNWVLTQLCPVETKLEDVFRELTLS